MFEGVKGPGFGFWRVTLGKALGTTGLLCLSLDVDEGEVFLKGPPCPDTLWPHPPFLPFDLPCA